MGENSAGLDAARTGSSSFAVAGQASGGAADTTNTTQTITGSDSRKAKNKHHGFSSATTIDEDRSTCYKHAYRFLKSHAFEHGMGIVIAINFAVVVVETDHNAKDAELPVWVNGLSWGLLTTFVLELVLKLWVLRGEFWTEGFNVFDFFVIAIDLFFSFLDVIGLNFINVSMLRVLRLSRLARAAKVLRAFPELHLMLAGLAGAVQAICWGTVLLFVALLVWSVLAVQFIHPLNLKVFELGYYEGCDRCPHAYESTFNAALTFTTQIVAGDSWGRETVPIIEVFPMSAILFLGVFVSVGLAILNLILGVVVNVATEARDGLLKQIADEKMLARLESHNCLLKMCQDMDEDGNDELCFDELQAGYDSNEDFRHCLEAMDIGPEDLRIVWTILDSDRSGTVTSKEFVSQIYKLKASDTQFMLAYIKFYVTEIKDKLRDDFKSLERSMTGVEAVMEKELEKIDDVLEVTMDNDARFVQVAATFAEQCDCGNTFMGDAKFCRKCGTRRKEVCECGTVFSDRAKFCLSCGSMKTAYTSERKAYTSERKGGDIIQNRQAAPVASSAAARSPPTQVARQPAALGPPVVAQQRPAANGFTASVMSAPVVNDYFNARDASLASIDTLFEKDSLLDLLGKVNLMEDEAALPMPNIRGSINEPEVLHHLEDLWERCNASIDDMRGFHTNLANLLESMVRRLSMSIAETVQHSVQQSYGKAKPFALAFRTTEGQIRSEDEFSDERYRDDFPPGETQTELQI